MAKKRTKKQKKRAEKKNNYSPKVMVGENGQISVGFDKASEMGSEKIGARSGRRTATKSKSITFSQSQVSLLRKDLFKTLITTLVVFGVLFLIYINFK